MDRQNGTSAITADALLPDVVTQYPGTRAVFDSYGLQGCGGPNGPRERIDWFARLHGVALEKLLSELNKAANTSGADFEFSPSIADTIYRPFFLAGITTVLTLGCLWGAINLFAIGVKKSFNSVDYSWVLAHGHAMVFGFVGLFIMGFAYQAFPRFKHTSLWRPRLAFSTLPLMVAGIVLQTIAHLLSPPSLTLGIFAAAIQLISISVFGLAITVTAQSAKKPTCMTGGNHWLLMMQWLTAITLLVVAIVTPFQFRLFGPVAENERDRGVKFVRAAYVWFTVAMAMLVFTPIYNFGIYVPLTGSHVPFSHAFFGAYRHALTVGFIMMMIVGVSSKVVPTLSGVDVRRAGSLWPTFLLLLIDDHGSLDKVLRELQTALQNSDLKTAHVKLDLFWARLAVHIRAEHLHLFPTILSSFENAAGSHVSAPSLDEAKTVVAQLRQDHDFFMHQLAVAVKIMRELLTLPEQLTGSDGMNNVKKILLEVQRRLVNHHELEENQIYRWATLLLNSEEQQKLREQITKELQNRPARFTLSTWSDE